MVLKSKYYLVYVHTIFTYISEGNMSFFLKVLTDPVLLSINSNGQNCFIKIMHAFCGSKLLLSYKTVRSQ